MDRSEFSQALARLSKHTIGIQEASVLFCITGETPNITIEEQLGLERRTIWSRTQALRVKGYVQSRYSPEGYSFHVLTKKGAKVVEDTLKLIP